MKKLTQIEFINKCNEIHNDKFDYSKTIYMNYRTKVIITCKKHGDFSIFPDNHMNKKQGCNKCALENHKLTEISAEKLENMKNIHNNKYSYLDLSVDSGMIKIICPNHGEFIQSIYNHKNGHGCYKCEKESRIKIRYRTCKNCNIKKEKNKFEKNHITCIKCSETTPEYKTCNKCKILKKIDEFNIRKSSFDGHRNECKICFNSSRTEPRKIYKQKNKEELRKKDIIYRKNRMNNDPLYRAKMDARNIIRKALNEGGYIKKSRTYEILGCSYIEFKNHLESNFTEGMNWNNRSEWQIDHIIPLSFAISEEEILKLNHYTNLRPLWAIDNLLKFNNITEETDIYYRILENR